MGEESESDLKILMVESYPLDLGSSLGLEDKSYAYSSDILKRKKFKMIYECRTGVLTPSQRKLYENFLEIVPEEMAVFLDPILVSFAFKDACDLSDVEYVWLELDSKEIIGSSAWVKDENQTRIFSLAQKLLECHLRKYIIDTYDRHTREDLAGVWKANLNLTECQVCGTSSIEKGLITVKGQKLRGWKCSSCGHKSILPSDSLEILTKTNKDDEKV